MSGWGVENGMQESVVVGTVVTVAVGSCVPGMKIIDNKIHTIIITLWSL